MTPDRNQLALDEEWLPVLYKNVNGEYLISNFGRLKNSSTGKILKHHFDTKGYPQYSLRINSFKLTVKAHRLVAAAFVKNNEDKPQVNHIDGNKQNNISSNLEWVTSKENTDHAIKNGLALPISGLSKTVKLKQNQVDEIRKIGNSVSVLDLSKRYGVHKTTIRDILVGNTWK